MVKLLLLFGFSACAYSSPLVITGGSFLLSATGEQWSFVGDGFSANGSSDSFTDHCGFCFAPFQLVDPLHFPITASNGLLTLGANSYILPGASFSGGSPFALGSVFLTPQGALPTATAAGTYNVPFNVGGSFCVTNDPHVPPPTPPNPACFSVLGTAVAHYTVIATGEPNAFFQPLPTIEILTPVPEPGTLGAGMLVMLLMLAGKYRKALPSATRHNESGCAAGS
jgi:hypothetical protein